MASIGNAFDVELAARSAAIVLSRCDARIASAPNKPYARITTCREQRLSKANAIGAVILAIVQKFYTSTGTENSFTVDDVSIGGK